MESKQEELRARTKKFALRIIRLFKSLPHSPEAQILGKQLLRSGTSVGAHYRAAGRARSGAEFSAEIGIVVEEAMRQYSSSNTWLRLVKEELLKDLMTEANELVAIFAASYRTAHR